MIAPPLVVIGASAGGPAALGAILEALPGSFPAAVVLVQHIDGVFAPGLAAWLGDHTALPVRLAADGDSLRAGTVLIADGHEHLVLSASGRVRYASEPRNAPYCPSIDVLFESVATHALGVVAGVLLTGMGRDGARGLSALRHAGAITIVQDQATSAIYGMPKAALAVDERHIVLPLGEIASRLVVAVNTPRPVVRRVRRG